MLPTASPPRQHEQAMRYWKASSRRRGGSLISPSLHKPLLFIVMKDQAGRRHQIPGERRIPELPILLQSLGNGDSLITFSGNLPDSAFPGSGKVVIQAHGSSVDRLFDFVLDCKLSPLLSCPRSARQRLLAYSYWLLNNSCELPGKLGTYSDVRCPWLIGVGYTVVRLGVTFPLFSF